MSATQKGAGRGGWVRMFLKASLVRRISHSTNKQPEKDSQGYHLQPRGETLHFLLRIVPTVVKRFLFLPFFEIEV